MNNILTVAMATYRDFDGVYFTLATLREFHGNQFDILVVDNAPEYDKRVHHVTAAAGGRYVHRPDLHGTAPPRDACFRLAKTPWVMVVDSHVVMCRGAVAAVAEYAKANPTSKDIVSGPILGDDEKWTATEWTRATPPGLWGVWATNPEYKARWGAGGLAGAAAADKLPPFEIFSMGLGCFAMRRAAWPGFHPLFRGFGGEEGYIHEKVRQLGGRAVCLPRARWRHRFRDIAGWSANQAAPYHPTTEDHTRNLLIGHRELGIDAAAAIEADFARKIPPAAWEAIKADVEATVPFCVIRPNRRPLKILGVWYSNNSAPPALLANSLKTVAAAKADAVDDVNVVTVAWNPVAGNPFQDQLTWTGWKGTSPVTGHAAIVAQQKAAIARGVEAFGEPDAVCFLEHDVLYPPDYFDRVGRAFTDHPAADVFSNLDYEGLNATGWLYVVERHEPMHQISMRYRAAVANLERCAAEAAGGQCLLEPDSAGGGRDEHHAEVEPGLWVGELGKKLPAGVDAVLNLSGSRTYHDTVADCLDVALSDDHRDPAPTLEQLAGWVGWVADRTAAGKSVLVHCLGGVSRSGLVTCAYLMAKHSVTPEAALKAVRRVRPQVAPRPAFWGLLAEYAKAIGATGATPPDVRAKWVRYKPTGLCPSIHVNHHTRFTSHGEVCYQKVSAGPDGHRRPNHPFWGDFKKWWPHEPAADSPGCGACGGKVPSSLQTWGDEVAAKASDFHEHVPTLRRLAGTVEHATEICSWDKPARVAIAAGGVKTLVSYSPTNRGPWGPLKQLMGAGFTPVVVPDPAAAKIDPTDLLFVDTNHRAAEVWRVFEANHANVSRYIVVHCTEIYGEKGDDGGPGVMPAVRRFVRDFPRWSVLEYHPNNYGLIVLGCRPEDKPELPSTLKMALNVAKAKWRHWRAGSVVIPLPMAEDRLKHCDVCTLRADDRCTKCGCYLQVVGEDAPAAMRGGPGKAYLPTESCPVGKWGMIDAADVPAETDDAFPPDRPGGEE